MQRSDCPIGSALDIIGDRWSFVIIRDAVYKGYRGYNEFLSSPEKISTNILAERLKKMTEFGIFEKIKDPDNGLKYQYLITQKGRDLIPAMIEVGKWGSKYIEGTLDITKKIEEKRD